MMRFDDLDADLASVVFAMATAAGGWWFGRLASAGWRARTHERGSAR
jgi:hypothetical protein